MVKSTPKGKKKTPAPSKDRLVQGVRLDLAPTDHDRLKSAARRRGLTMASYARMAVLERLETDQPRGGEK
jgi:hypothetical protein